MPVTTEATDSSEEVQVRLEALSLGSTETVTNMLLSRPSFTVPFLSSTTFSGAGLTVSRQAAFLPLAVVAVILAEPTFRPVSSTSKGPLPIRAAAATFGFSDPTVSSVTASEGVTVMAMRRVSPTPSSVLLYLNFMPVGSGGLTVTLTARTSLSGAQALSVYANMRTVPGLRAVTRPPSVTLRVPESSFVA